MSFQNTSFDQITHGSKNVKGYIIVLIGQILSLLGSEIVQFVIIWYLTIETENIVVLGLATMLGIGSQILLTPFAGVLIDRWNRKVVIIVADLLEAFAGLMLWVLFLTNSITIGLILLLLGFRGAFAAFHTPALQAIIPLLISKEKLSRINGLNYFSSGVIILIGPIIAAFLLSIWPMHQIIWIDILTFLLAIMLISPIEIPVINQTSKAKKTIYFLMDEFKHGIGFISTRKPLRSLLIIYSSANFFIHPVFVLLPLLVISLHNGSADDLAIILAIQQFGLLISAFSMSVWKGFENKTQAIFIGVILVNICNFLVAISPIGNFWLIAIGMAGIGIGRSVIVISDQTVWHSIVPEELQGRIYSVRFALTQSVSLVAIAITTLLAEILGIIELIILASILELIILFGIYLRNPLFSLEAVA